MKSLRGMGQCSLNHLRNLNILDCEVYDDDKVVFVGMKYFVDADGNSKGKGEPISFTGVFRGDILDVNFPEGFVQLIKRY